MFIQVLTRNRCPNFHELGGKSLWKSSTLLNASKSDRQSKYNSMTSQVIIRFTCRPNRSIARSFSTENRKSLDTSFIGRCLGKEKGTQMGTENEIRVHTISKKKI